MHENIVHKESYINITNYCYFENAVFEAVRWILRVYRTDVKMRVETIGLMNTQFFNDLRHVDAII